MDSSLLAAIQGGKKLKSVTTVVKGTDVGGRVVGSGGAPKGPGSRPTPAIDRHPHQARGPPLGGPPGKPMDIRSMLEEKFGGSAPPKRTHDIPRRRMAPKPPTSQSQRLPLRIPGNQMASVKSVSSKSYGSNNS